LIFEDEHLLVVNKPAGLNTHSPSPYSGEGLYDWLRHREPRWARLAIIHRLDKETSGVIVFSKTPEGNRALTQQFEERRVRKKYLFLTEGSNEKREFTLKSCLLRAGERYISRPMRAGGGVAETRFRWVGIKPQRRDERREEDLRTKETGRSGLKLGNELELWEAQPLTGRTHQIRVHAAESGIPIMGDALYGGKQAARVFLHAAEIAIRHPATMEDMNFRVEPDFDADPRWRLREGLIDFECNDSCRVIHGSSDATAGWYVDRFGKFALSQEENEPSAERTRELIRMPGLGGARGFYHKKLVRDAGRAKVETEARLIHGEAAPERFIVTENGMRFELSFEEGYSVGIFLDQRDNRRRLLTAYVGMDFWMYEKGVEPMDAAGKGAGRKRLEVLNTFAYTCGFSVCAAKGGARVTSVDLSKKYLEWGKRNFELNGLDAAEHDFIYGDVFDWLRRLAKKGRQFDVVLLDPPTFSQSKEFGAFRAEKDYGKLVGEALPLLKRNGVFFCSSNAARWEPERFLSVVKTVISKSKREIVQEKYYPQPPDFPISREQPGYLKTVWLRVD
jgi:23S rRNA (cytosine1962-C5)-methyltransferase